MRSLRVVRERRWLCGRLCAVVANLIG